MAKKKQLCQSVPEGFYDSVENDLLRNYLISNNYGTIVDLEDEQNQNLTVKLIIDNQSNEFEEANGNCRFILIEVDSRYLEDVQDMKESFLQKEVIRENYFGKDKFYMRFIKGKITNGKFKLLKVFILDGSNECQKQYLYGKTYLDNHYMGKKSFQVLVNDKKYLTSIKEKTSI